MSEYIDIEVALQKAIKEKKFVFSTHDIMNNEVVVKTVYNDLAEFLYSLPRADVVEVVRCANCTALMASSGGSYCARLSSTLQKHYVRTDGFCSCGERRKSDA